MNRSIKALALLIAAGTITITAHASTLWRSYDHYIPGVSCRANLSTDESCIQYSGYGAHNTCSHAVSVLCPFLHSHELNRLEAQATMMVYGFDRSATEDLSCTIVVQNYTGNFDYTTLATSGFGSDQKSISFSSWWQGYGRGGGPAFLDCSIPAVTANGVSHLTNIDLGVTITQ